MVVPGYGGGIIVTAVTTAGLASRTIFVRMRSRADFTITLERAERDRSCRITYNIAVVQCNLVWYKSLRCSASVDITAND